MTIPRWESTDPVGLDINYEFYDATGTSMIGHAGNFLNRRKEPPNDLPVLGSDLMYDMKPIFHNLY